jgi:hypothetical protein
MASEADFLLAFGMAALARTPVLREASPVGHFPPLWDVHRRDPQRPLHVDSCRPRHSPKLRERGNFDPELPFEIGPLNGWEVRENGLRLTASGAPGSDAAAMSSRSSSWELRRYGIARNERSSQFRWIFNDRVRCEYIQLSAGADVRLFFSFLSERRA